MAPPATYPFIAAIFFIVHIFLLPNLKQGEDKRRDSNASDKSEEGDSKRTNQFSFVERATQTMNNALKV